MILVGGATATGKSGLAIEIARLVGGEIISADSMQIYKGMDVGTAKELNEKEIKHHLIDVVLPNEPFTVVDFRRLATEKIAEIRSRGRIPIVVGGTGLYFDSLLYKMEYGGGGKEENVALKEELERELKEKGAEYMHARLKELDRVSAEKYHYNNTVRVLRALYVVLNTGKPISSQKATYCPIEEPLMLVTKRDRGVLRKKITARIDEMFAMGLEDEVRTLLEKGYGFELQSMQAIGYKEWAPFFLGNATVEDVKEQIDVNTRQYAKRQDTWFNNRYKELAYFVDMDAESVKEIAKNVVKEYESIIK